MKAGIEVRRRRHRRRHPCAARQEVSNSRDLGLLIVDEEQHFGVQHKERLKQLRADVHVLTLTATPIPRTLQLALTGVREMSLIATPPVDRLAVRTFVTPFDPVDPARGAAARALSRRPELLRRAAHRRPRRGGGVPRRSTVPELKVGVAPRPDGAGRARGRDDRLLRRQVRRAAVDHDRRIRPRHPDGQHADRASRRHVRARSALSAARPRRAFQDPRLRLFHDARRPRADACGREAAQGAAIARHAGRRLPARQPRPRHPRRRQSPGRGAVRPHQGGRLRALSADAGRGGGGAQRAAPRARSRTNGRRSINHRHARC